MTVRPRGAILPNVPLCPQPRAIGQAHRDNAFLAGSVLAALGSWCAAWATFRACCTRADCARKLMCRSACRFRKLTLTNGCRGEVTRLPPPPVSNPPSSQNARIQLEVGTLNTSDTQTAARRDRDQVNAPKHTSVSLNGFTASRRSPGNEPLKGSVRLCRCIISY